MKKDKIVITLNTKDIIAGIKEKHGDTPVITEKAKKLQSELKENKQLASQLNSLKKK